MMMRSSLIIILSLSLLLVFVTLPCSSSNITLHHSTPKYGFQISLRHVDSGKNLTKFERIRQALNREKQRRQGLSAMLVAGQQISSQIHPTITGFEYVMQVAIGTPPVDYNAVINTGADLIWTQCKPCSNCQKQSTPLFDSTKSSSFADVSCKSDFCAALATICDSGQCTYTYAYSGYSYTNGVMATETFTFDKNVKVPNIVFGCGHDNQFPSEDGFAGLMGMGRGTLSLVSQLNEPMFSYCLPSLNNDAKNMSTLFMGSLPPNLIINNALLKTTPLVKNKIFPSFYYISMQGITVGGVRLDLDEDTFAINEYSGSGGMAIDASTTNTVLQEQAFNTMANEFASQMKATVDDTSSEGYVACFNLRDPNVKVPKLVFHFENADLELENYMINDPMSKKLCLTMSISSDGTSVFGNMQQRNMLVVYDTKKEMVSFMPTSCDHI